MFDKSSPSLSDFDQYLVIFYRFMSFKVQNIQLVSIAYDVLIMEEDGSITTIVIKEYWVLSLTGAPLITRIFSFSEALNSMRYKKYERVITMPFLKCNNAFDIGMELKKINPGLLVILRAHHLQAVQLSRNEKNYYGIDNNFMWSSVGEIPAALAKNVEDHVSVPSRDTGQ